jgi:hypothetical protein
VIVFAMHQKGIAIAALALLGFMCGNATPPLHACGTQPERIAQASARPGFVEKAPDQGGDVNTSGSSLSWSATRASSGQTMAVVAEKQAQ